MRRQHRKLSTFEQKPTVNPLPPALRLFAALCFAAAATGALAQAPREPYQPTMGQQGKDVVWIPSPQILVEKMLDMARVTAHD